MKRYIFSILFALLAAIPAVAQDSTLVFASSADSTDWRIHRYRKHWMALIPTQSIFQYAGNMGLFSVGMGWDYGRHKQWETNLLFGFLPKYRSGNNKITMTLKQNFIPWSFRLNDLWAVEPLSCGLYMNTVFGSEFWNDEPARYPDDYYPFLNTKVRLNIFLGQRVELIVPKNRRKLLKSITAFYEVSACDLHIRAKFQSSHVKIKDILSLSLGLKFQLL